MKPNDLFNLRGCYQGFRMATLERHDDLTRGFGEIFNAIWRAANEGTALWVRLPTGFAWETYEPLASTYSAAFFHEYRPITGAVPDEIPENLRIIYVLEVAQTRRAVELLKAGHSVAAIVPDDSHKIGWFMLGDLEVKVFDGDLSEVRCEPRGSLILFRQTSTGQSARPHLIKQLQTALEGGA